MSRRPDTRPPLTRRQAAVAELVDAVGMLVLMTVVVLGVYGCGPEMAAPQPHHPDLLPPPSAMSNRLSGGQ